MLEKMRNNFFKPGDEYTPIPFWFWNHDLKEETIKKQIHDFKDKGVMGFVIHPRIGIPKEIEYLSDRFMELVKFAVEEGARLGMTVVLYDEAMYPSGSAHGMVVKGNPEYATRGLKMMEYPCSGKLSIAPQLEQGESIVSALAVEKLSEDTINPLKTMKLDIIDGTINFEAPVEGNWAILLFVMTFTRGNIRGIHFGEDDKEPEAPPSADLLNPAAIKKFIDLTHERYYAVLKEYFGNTIIAMFTDEPDMLGRGHIRGVKPWTGEFLEFYIQQGNREIDLPILWFNAGSDTEEIRRNYKKAVNKRLETAYYKQISDWCEAHGIALAGHPHESDDIGFLKYFHIPGQDIVWRWVAPENGLALEGQHSTMGKCSADAARHMGRRRNANECFGCCGPDGDHWAFSAGDMKWYLDWLAVRGVNLFYPHAFFYSIEGERRFGERPPDVGPNNIWWKYYHSVSDYIKRVCWLMTDSANVTPVAVLCREDYLPWAIVKPLFQNQIEFNYLEDNLLIALKGIIKDGNIAIERQRYELLIIESADMITPEVESRLKEFLQGGGKVILLNNDGKKAALPGIIEIKSCDELVDKIDQNIQRDCTFYPANPHLRVSHIVKDGLHIYFIVNEGEDTAAGNLHTMVKGKAELWDAWRGTAVEAAIQIVEDGGMSIPVVLHRRESLAICIDPTAAATLMVDNTLENAQIKREITLDTGWKISGLPASVAQEITLESWTCWQGMEEFTGTLEYHITFNLDNLNDVKSICLDLGRVEEIVHVYANGNDAGFKLWAPYTIDLTGILTEGMNTLKIEVTNSMANRINKSRRPSGLLGPVKLIMK